MDVSRITPSVLTEDRLDASYYGTRYLQNESLLKKCCIPMAPVGTLTDKCNCGATPKEVVYDGNGTGLVRTTDVRPNVFLAEGVLRTSELRVSQEASVAAVPGDLLYTMSGTIGYAAVIHDGVDIVSFSNTIARARFAARTGQDARFTAAFFNCKYGYTQSLRLVSGGIQGHVMPNPFKRLAVPTPAPDSQRYIGDKVRQAERLRERARRLEAEFRNAVIIAIASSASIAGKTSRVGTCELGRNLNPGACTPDRRAVRAAIRGAGGRSLDTLADVESPTTDSYPATAPYLGLDAIDSATCGLRPSTADAESVAGTARLLREGPALSRLRPYLNKVTYIPPTLAGGIGSTELLLVRPKTGVDGWFLYGVLKLESSIRQLNPVATGSTHPRVDREDVLDLLVPWRDEHETLGAKLRAAQACYFASAALTLTATTLVETLIDGRLTEVDLVAAQKALEAGDRSADREILKALLRSDAPDAKPLIANVDALYALLHEAEGQDA